ncbi:hypothetical protein BC832DRAFT_565434, partial [Gaertneriomyces semiglobifer]
MASGEDAVVSTGFFWRFSLMLRLRRTLWVWSSAFWYIFDGMVSTGAIARM